MRFKDYISELVEREGVIPLARRLKVSRQLLYYWRTGRVKPSYRIIEQLGGVVFFPDSITCVRSSDDSESEDGNGNGKSFYPSREAFHARLEASHQSRERAGETSSTGSDPD
jgi:hypothetical protein